MIKTFTVAYLRKIHDEDFAKEMSRFDYDAGDFLRDLRSSVLYVHVTSRGWVESSLKDGEMWHHASVPGGYARKTRHLELAIALAGLNDGNGETDQIARIYESALA